MTAEFPQWMADAFASPIFWSVLAAALTYLVQKRLDRREQIRLIRQEAYRRFLDRFLDAWRLALIKDEGEWRKFEDSRQEMMLVASDEVARAVMCFAQPSISLDDRNAKLASLILAMRRDCFSNTRLAILEIVDNLPTSGPTKGQSDDQ